ncbi:MAG: DUF2344 domain-containing protein [Planctomycetota bacterium]|nr:MAG: DUF2344 domain-containing protein [Planctomycetota bacterium]
MKEAREPAEAAPAPAGSGAPPRYCVEYEKDGPARLLAHLDLQEALERALRRARLPLAYTQGFHPRPRLQFEDPLPLGWRSECERLWIELERAFPPAETLLRLAATAPPGLRFLRVYPVARAQPPGARCYRVRGCALPADAAERVRVAFPGPAEAGGRAPVALEPGDGGWRVTLRPLGRAPAPSLKKVLVALLGEPLPADLDVLRLAAADEDGT